MSGYGGNLTYPQTKLFINGDVSASLADYIANVTDGIVGSAAAADNILWLPKSGDYVVNLGHGEYSEVDNTVAVPRVTDVQLDNRAPCDECNAELGFIVNGINRDPGVMNMNYYGFRRTYAHKFEKLDAIVGGLISDEDLMEAYADICQQIYDDVGRGGANLYGNTESTVWAFMQMVFSATVAGATFDIPSVGLYGATLAAAAAYIDSPLAKAPGTVSVGNSVIGESYLTYSNAIAASMYVGQSHTIAVTTPIGAKTVTKIVEGAVNTVVFYDEVWTNAAAATITVAAEPEKVVNRAAGITTPGLGFVVHPAGAETLVTADSKLSLTTKDAYDEYMTHQLEDVDGIFLITTAGSFELLSFAEVFREFAHMAHDVPLSNHHAVDKPTSTSEWHKFILYNTQTVGDFHGASHGNAYKESLVLYVQKTGTMVADVKAVIDTWIAATP